METFIAVHRNHYGEIVSFVTSTGRIISYQKALLEVEKGLIDGVTKLDDLEGHPYLQPSIGDSFEDLPNTF